MNPARSVVRLNANLAGQWARVATRFMPFADAATHELPLGRLLRLSLFQVSVGLALVLLNVVPMVALWASRQNPSLGIVALAADGFISGIALGPLLAIANYLAPNSIPGALAVTGGVFVAVTGYVMFSKEKFSAPAGLLTGMFFALVIAMIVNSFIQMSGLGLIITIGIGIFGVVSLVYATSDVLNNPEYDNPVQGALMLFAALFNIFVTALRLLLRFSSRD